MTVDKPTTSTQRVESPNNGDKLPLEAPTDQWGDTHEDRERYPEGTPARDGETTAPVGSGWGDAARRHVVSGSVPAEPRTVRVDEEVG